MLGPSIRCYARLGESEAHYSQQLRSAVPRIGWSRQDLDTQRILTISRVVEEELLGEGAGGRLGPLARGQAVAGGAGLPRPAPAADHHDVEAEHEQHDSVLSQASSRSGTGCATSGSVNRSGCSSAVSYLGSDQNEYRALLNGDAYVGRGAGGGCRVAVRCAQVTSVDSSATPIDAELAASGSNSPGRIRIREEVARRRAEADGSAFSGPVKLFASAESALKHINSEVLEEASSSSAAATKGTTSLVVSIFGTSGTRALHLIDVAYPVLMSRAPVEDHDELLFQTRGETQTQTVGDVVDGAGAGDGNGKKARLHTRWLEHVLTMVAQGGVSAIVEEKPGHEEARQIALLLGPRVKRLSLVAAISPWAADFSDSVTTLRVIGKLGKRALPPNLGDDTDWIRMLEKVFQASGASCSSGSASSLTMESVVRSSVEKADAKQRERSSSGLSPYAATLKSPRNIGGLTLVNASAAFAPYLEPGPIAVAMAKIKTLSISSLNARANTSSASAEVFALAAEDGPAKNDPSSSCSAASTSPRGAASTRPGFKPDLNTGINFEVMEGYASAEPARALSYYKKKKKLNPESEVVQVVDMVAGTVDELTASCTSSASSGICSASVAAGCANNPSPSQLGAVDLMNNSASSFLTRSGRGGFLGASPSPVGPSSPSDAGGGALGESSSLLPARGSAALCPPDSETAAARAGAQTGNADARLGTVEDLMADEPGIPAVATVFSSPSERNKQTPRDQLQLHVLATSQQESPTFAFEAEDDTDPSVAASAKLSSLSRDEEGEGAAKNEAATAPAAANSSSSGTTEHVVVESSAAAPSSSGADAERDGAQAVPDLSPINAAKTRPVPSPPSFGKFATAAFNRSGQTPGTMNCTENDVSGGGASSLGCEEVAAGIFAKLNESPPSSLGDGGPKSSNGSPAMDPHEKLRNALLASPEPPEFGGTLIFEEGEDMSGGAGGACDNNEHEEDFGSLSPTQQELLISLT
eukprot:g2393.t1